MNSKRVLSTDASMGEHSSRRCSRPDYKGSRPNNLLQGAMRVPDEERANLWSPCSNCSSDDNNSPTALNSFNWDKPALEDKSVDFGWPKERTQGSSLNSKHPHFSGKGSDGKPNGYVEVNSEDSKISTCSRDQLTKNSQKREQKLSESCGSLNDSSTKESLYPTKEQIEDSAVKIQQDLEERHIDLDSVISENERSEESIRKEREELRKAAWFQAGIPREIALEVLAEKPEGTFIVRESTTKPGCYALSLRVPPGKNPDGIAHYLILRTNKGYKIKGFTKEFTSLIALITHHSVMPEMLPCPLSLSRHTTRDAEQEFEDTEQKTCDIFSDIHWVMTDLEV